MIIVSKDGSGNFDSIQSAINSIPESNDKEVVIFIKKGIYNEKIKVLSPYVTLKGEDAKDTIITYDDYAKKEFANGEKYETFNSYTMFVYGHHFIGENLTIENTAGDGRKVGQAVALYVEGDCEKFKNCRILGNQDTLFTGPLPKFPIDRATFGGPMEGKERIVGRQYYENCYIEGDVDFIFGSATAVFNRCNIFSKNRDEEINGYITAPSTYEGQEYGYVFFDCILKSDAKKNSVFLGRPWRDYAKSVFIDCYMGEHIKIEGFDDWNKENAIRNCYFAEYNSYGKGGLSNHRVKFEHLLNKNEVQNYKIDKILCGNDKWNYKFNIK